MKDAQQNYSHITTELLEKTIHKAKNSVRKRVNHNFHELSDTVQRMLNAIEPDSYCRPHRHIEPPKTETFILLKGDLSVIIFDEQGIISEVTSLNDRTGNKGIDIKPGVWHTLVSNISGTVIFETKTGPYLPVTDKEFAPWAPAEGAPQAFQYLKKLHQQIRELQNT